MMLVQAGSGPWARVSPCPWAAWSPGWVLAVALATQLPYKPWNAIALPVLLTLGQLAWRPLLEGRLCLWHRALRGVLPPARARHRVSAREGVGLHSTPAWSRDPEGTVQGWSHQRRCPRACRSLRSTQRRLQRVYSLKNVSLGCEPALNKGSGRMEEPPRARGRGLV